MKVTIIATDSVSGRKAFAKLTIVLQSGSGFTALTDIPTIALQENLPARAPLAQYVGGVENSPASFVLRGCFWKTGLRLDTSTGKTKQ